MFLLLSVIAILVTPALAQVDCTGKADGPHGVGCYSYTQCTGGSGTTIECQGGKVFDANATPPGCNDIAAVTTSCSFIDDCGSVSGDVRFAVPGDCSHFYRCTRGKFKGVHPCAYPTS